MLARIKSVEIGAGYVGIHEQGGANRGPVVDMFTGADTLPGVGYAWCQSFQNGIHRLATGGRVVGGMIVGGEMLAGGTAGVELFYSVARQNSWVVSRPLKGDRVIFDFDGNGVFDHVAIIEKVISLGPVFILQTIEGNTSSDDRGSQANGGGVYRRRRVMSARKLRFIRVPGDAKTYVAPKPAPKPVVKPKPVIRKRVFDLLVDGKVVVRDQKVLGPVLARAAGQITSTGVKSVTLRKRFV